MDFGVHIPFVTHLGFELRVFEGGSSELFFPTRAEHRNSFDVIHGGAVMTLMDVAMATAARSVEPTIGIVTIEMKTSFLMPAKGSLTARGRLLHRTRKLAFTEASVFGADGQLCAHSTGTFRYVTRQQPIPTD